MKLNILYTTIFFICTMCIAKSYGNNKDDIEPHVRTPLGQIKGSILMSRQGKTIYSFKGVRYAEAPVGNLRFKPPVPARSWIGIYNATEDPPACPQPGKDNISEDCLFLNVYTTKLKCSTKIKAPVMVFFHPGGFYEGSCNSLVYGPEYLLDKDVVLVVPNYRLGSLGFLSTGTKDAPGNNGMKDQVTVLRWVKDNIASFCGDPNLVTIFGYSAGGLSVTAHVMSPMSRGLFHRAIAMSGSIFGPLPIYTNQLDLAKKQARILNCPDSTPEEIISCLNTKTAKEMGDSLSGFDVRILRRPNLDLDSSYRAGFRPGEIPNRASYCFGAKKDFANVPVMIGITTDEFGSRSFDVVDNSTVLEEYDKDFLRIWPIIYCYERKPPLSHVISKGLRKFYFPNGINSSTRKGVTDLYADGVIGFSANRGSKLLSQYSSEKVFYYLFNYHGKITHAYYPNTNNTIPYGVSHHDDLLYLFYVSVMTPLFNNGTESEIVDKMITMWSNFARLGYPISKEGSISWNPFNSKSEFYMEIDTELNLRQKLYEDRYRTWDELIPFSN
ncbi:carboxylesterase [Holotrichia oblita]|uniref:Carboxylesterase n=1 Tax=Holotrichia oblita TaxID=644536 RepID=A0ACB9SM89_HOLOL|nr:carboxylesterase [Holotrichia oblita]